MSWSPPHDMEARQRELEQHVAATAKTSDQAVDNLAQIRKLLSGIDDKLASIRASAYVITVCAILATLALLAR